jgi:hypothetical protein
VVTGDVCHRPPTRRFTLSDTEYLVIGALKRARRANVPVTGFEEKFRDSVSRNVSNISRFLPPNSFLGEIKEWYNRT